MAIPARQSDDRQRVLDATDIVQLIGEHIALRAKGREYAGLCPFHDDHRPSMTVVPSKGIYKCFSCGAGGNAIDFVVNYHKMSFREALEHLAERANIKLTPWRPAGGRPGEGDDGDAPGQSRRAILAANLTACDFFRLILNHPEHGRTARELVERRGLTPEMVRLFNLGAAPDKWDGLTTTIAAKRLDAAPFIAAGLLKRRESGSGVYDAFRDRLIFPITDQIGRVVGFGGRRLSDAKREDGGEDAKYLNSAESPVFDKSTTLYALHQAAPALRSTRIAIVVEGYMDAIACHQAGIRNAVATLGTALTAGNARILRRQCEQVVLLFDGDEAGRRAAQRGVEIFFAEPIDVRIAMLRTVTDAKDPDELLKRPDGRELFNQAIAKAVDPLSLLLEGVRVELGGRGISGQSRVADEFLTRLAALGLSRVEPVRKQLILRRLSELTRVDAETLMTAFAAKASQVRHFPAAGASAGAGGEARPRLTLAEGLLGCILCDPSLAYSLEEDPHAILTDGLPSDPATQRVVEAALSLLAAGTQPALAAVLATLDDTLAQRAATTLASEIDRLAERRPDRVRELWAEWLAESYRERAKRHIADLDMPLGDEASPEGQKPIDSDSWLDAARRLEQLRTLAEAVGTDRRILPTTRT